MPVWDFICLIFDGYTLGVLRAFVWGMIDDGKRLFVDGKRLFVDGTRLFVDGTRLFVDGTRLFVDGTRLFVDGTRLFVDGTMLFVDGTRFSCELLLICGIVYEFYLSSLTICWLLPSLNKSNTLLLSLISSISNLLITASTNPSAASKFIRPFISILIFISSFHSSEGYVFELTISIKLLTMRSCWASGVKFRREMGRGSMRLRAKLWLSQSLT
jgi:hypothetical protein